MYIILTRKRVRQGVVGSYRSCLNNGDPVLQNTAVFKKKIVWCRSTLILLDIGSPRVPGYLGTGSPGEASHLLEVVSLLNSD